MRENPTSALCILVKSPVAGRVKTRLVPSLTQDEAAERAAAFFADTLALAHFGDWARVVVACDDDPSSLALAFDVDVPADLSRLVELLRDERIFAPRTGWLLAGATGWQRSS